MNRRRASARPRKRRSSPKSWSAPLLLGGAAIAGSVIGIGSIASPSSLTPGYSDTVRGCSVTDGDTIRCGDERIRLLGIDAPELPGHCRWERVCAPGDPYASTRSLSAAMAGTLRIDRVGQDHYGRTLARVAGDKGDLSCWQLQHDHAIYKAEWDDGFRVARTCPDIVTQ